MEQDLGRRGRPELFALYEEQRGKFDTGRRRQEGTARPMHRQHRERVGS